MCVPVICWHCPPCHLTAREPARRIFHFWKVQWNGDPCDHRAVFPSVKYCRQDTAWHSFSPIFWQFEQTNRKWLWFLAPVGHVWRRRSSVACAMPLKYPFLPQTSVACFPDCGKGYRFQFTRSRCCLHTPLTVPNPASGWGERKRHSKLLYCCLSGGRGCACT